METVRIGCVQYLNTLPLIEGLRAWRDCELVTAVPANLIGLLHRGEVDVALASVIDAARMSERGGVTLLPVGMIGCDGPTLTVRVFSRTPIESLDTIAADTDSHTSVALLRVIMARKFGRSIRIPDFDAREHMVLGSGGTSEHPREGDWPDAVLLIGDKVVTDAPPQQAYPHQLDLGAAWKEMTGLPFVYAMWMCRTGSEESAAVRTASMMLDRARRHNATRMDWLTATRASEKGWPRDLAAQYLGSYLKFDVEDPEREAAEKFVRWAADAGACEHAALRWADARV